MSLCRIFGVIVILSSACMPQHLQKYRRKDQAQKQDTSAPASDLDGADREPALPSSQKTAKKAVPAAPPAARIYAIDQQTFRFLLNDKDVWEAAINVLMKNYALTIVDRQSSIITTEWDTFYLNNIVYRNKISMRLRKNSNSGVDVMVHNSVERLQEGAGGLGAVWLPSEDVANELNRVIQNMAIMLNESPPRFSSPVADQTAVPPTLPRTEF